ncbi:hypothetical protein QIS07_gp3 [ssRNA phage Gephyllon.4_1]|uniref:Uncharacterized protein n=2 Tax=Leviviricetes TaxID=2842243 RepID=A0A8S5L4N2_9VIRU|nr:hypothetical protein QIS07_gp3 [ssRNA phage Gephyllon.4_1]QDH89087.1 MAG: hypothetical protein H4BulkLitter22251_000002 [Leviviridae sp.]DAD52154.1 TPA_asm: hypothetical protein [ssRNA phage Gephyllon.4_1]
MTYSDKQLSSRERALNAITDWLILNDIEAPAEFAEMLLDRLLLFVREGTVLAIFRDGEL